MIYYKNKSGQIVEYYHKDEADEMGLKYVPWRDATETGQWVLSDDNIIVKVVYVKYITELQQGGITPRVRRKIKTELAIRYPHGKAPMNLKEHMKTRSYGLIPMYWWQKYQRDEPGLNTALVRLIMACAINLSERKKYWDYERAEMDKIAAKFWISGNKINGNNIRQYLNVNEVRMQLQEEIRKKALERGWSVEKVMNMIDRAEGYADAKGDAKALLAVAKEVGATIGMMSKLPPSGNQLPPATDEDSPVFDKVIAEEKTEEEVPND